MRRESANRGQRVDFLGRVAQEYRSLIPDGSGAYPGPGFGAGRDSGHAWLFDGGPQELFPEGEDGRPIQILDASKDGLTYLAGRGSSARFLRTLGGAPIEITPPPGEAISYLQHLSGNGRHAAGSLAFWLPTVPRVHAYYWSQDGGSRILDPGPGFNLANALDVANDGTVFGFRYGERSTPFGTTEYFQTRPVRWRPGESAEWIEGINDQGRSWRMRQFVEADSTGGYQLGYGEIEIELGGGAGIEERAIAAVFDENGPSWLLADETTEMGAFGIYGSGFDLIAMSGDGSTVIGRAQVGADRPFTPYVVWRRGDGTARRSFTDFLGDAGVALPDEFAISGLYDVSHDGTAFLVRGIRSQPEGRFEEAIFIVVIPEPRTAALMGLGLAAMSRYGRSRGPASAAT